MADALETLEIEVKHKSTGAIQEIDKLADALQRLNRYLAGVTIPKMEDFANALGNISKATEKIQKATKKDNPIEQISDDTAEAVRNASKLQVLFGKLESKRNKMESALSNGDLSGALSARGAMLSAQAAIRKEQDAVVRRANEESSLTGKGGLSGVLGKIKSATAGVASGFKSISDRVNGMGNAMGKAFPKVSKLMSSLGRVAFYRAIRTAIKEITSAVSEGLTNVYAFSSTIGSVISQTMDSLAGLSLQMKNQMGAAFGELLATIRPILEYIIQLITKAADILAQFFAVLGGRNTYHKALGTTQKWAESTEKGAAAAKEWKNQLLGFDEINRLEAPTDTGSGSGGGGGANAGAYALSPITLDLSWLDKYKEATMEWLQNLNFDPLLRAWDRLKEVVLEFLNIVDGALFWAYTNILLPLAKWVIERAAPASVELLASMFNFLNAVIVALAPAFQWLWSNVLQPFATFIGNVLIKALNWLRDAFDGLATKIRNSKSLGEFLDKLNGKETLVLGIATAVGVLATAFLAFKTVNTIIGAFGAVVGALTSPIGIAMIAITALIVIGVALYQNWDEICAGLKSLWEKITDAFQKVVDFLDKHFWWLVDSIEKAWEGLKGIFKGIIDFVAGVFTGDWDRAFQGIAEIFVGVVDVITSAIDMLFGWLHSLINLVSNAISWIQGLFDGLNAVAQSNVARIEADGSIYLQGFASGGFPEEGQLFMAREAGAEMVGSIGGRTAVANNDQIVEAVSQGVYVAVSDAIGGMNDRPIKVYIDGREIKNSQRRIDRAWGV